MDRERRRQFLAGVLQAGVCFPFLGSRLCAAEEVFVPLRQLAAEKGVEFGFAVDPVKLNSDPTYQDVVARQASIVVPENALKWQAVHPEPERYDFGPADVIAAFAQAHHQRMRGHTFCWHRALPAWVTGTVTQVNAEKVLVDHIGVVASRYRGRISSWDVVNEAIQIDDAQPGGLRNAFWYHMLGPRYLDIAFHAAHEADPAAVLCYNDYGLESEGRYGDSKRAAVLAMLRGFRQRGVPVGALGIQSHLRASEGGDKQRFGDGLASFITAVRNLGFSVYVTELDVDDSLLSGSDEARDGIVADTYKRYLNVVLGTRAVSAILTWGVWDTPHRTGATPGNGPLAQRPLVFGPQGEVKPASWVVEHGLQRMDKMGSG